MEEKRNTERGTRHHDKDELPKPILNNEIDPDSTKVPLDNKLKNSTTDRSNKEQNNPSKKQASK